MELYLDNCATSTLDPEVKALYDKLNNEYFASTGSLHSLGVRSLELETIAKTKIANYFHVKPNEILFNSGATEGNNFAIKGVALKYKSRGNTIITSSVEHPSVLECFKQLEKDFGFNCIYLSVDENGQVDINELERVMSDDVILVSIMYTNHEVGTIMPFKEISNIVRRYKKAILHADITQAIGKCDIDFKLFDIATMSAHKIHGLKGSGLMYKKESLELYDLISGHPANNSLRAGTSNFIANVCLELTIKKALENLKNNYQSLKDSQIKLIAKLKEIKGVVINTNPDYSIPNIINISIPTYNSEVVIRALSMKGIYVSSRSVCSVNSKEKYSLTLKSMGRDNDVITSSIRISNSEPLNDDEISYFCKSLSDVLKTTFR